MNRTKESVALGLGAAAVLGAAMLLRPTKNRRMKKAMKRMGKVVNTVSDLMGW